MRLGKRETSGIEDSLGYLARGFSWNKSQHFYDSTDIGNCLLFLFGEFLERIVSSFHVYVRPNEFKEFSGTEFIEDEYSIHRCKGSNDASAVFFGVNWTVGPF